MLTQTNVDKLMRLSDVLEMYPVSKSSWWQGVKDGRYPEPVKLGPRMTAWRLSDISQLIEHGPKQQPTTLQEA